MAINYREKKSPWNPLRGRSDPGSYEFLLCLIDDYAHNNNRAKLWSFIIKFALTSRQDRTSSHLAFLLVVFFIKWRLEVFSGWVIFWCVKMEISIIAHLFLWDYSDRFDRPFGIPTFGRWLAEGENSTDRLPFSPGPYAFINLPYTSQLSPLFPFHPAPLPFHYQLPIITHTLPYSFTSPYFSLQNLNHFYPITVILLLFSLFVSKNPACRPKSQKTSLPLLFLYHFPLAGVRIYSRVIGFLDLQKLKEKNEK